MPGTGFVIDCGRYFINVIHVKPQDGDESKNIDCMDSSRQVEDTVI